LNARLRIDAPSPELQKSRLEVTPFDPGRQARKVQPALLEESCAIDGVKCILKVHLKNHLVLARGVAKEPLTRGVDADLCPEGLRHADLQRKEIGSSLGLEGLAQALADESPPRLTDGNGSDASILLGKGRKGSSSEKRCHGAWGATAGKKLNQ